MYCTVFFYGTFVVITAAFSYVGTFFPIFNIRIPYESVETLIVRGIVIDGFFENGSVVLFYPSALINQKNNHYNNNHRQKRRGGLDYSR